MSSNHYNHLPLSAQHFCKMMEKTATDAFEKRYYEYLSNVKEEKFEKECFSSIFDYQPSSFYFDKDFINPQLYGEEGFILRKIIKNICSNAVYIEI